MVVHTACNAVVILKMEARPGCTITKAAAAWPGKRIRTKKVTCKLQQGVKFTVDVEFGFVTMISVKLPEGKKTRIVSSFMMLKTVIFVLVQIEKVIVCKKAHFLVFIGYPSLKDLLLNAHN